MIINPETGHVSPQFHMVLDDEFTTVPFVKEGTIPPNWTYIVQHISKSGAPYNIDLNDTWINPDIEEDTIETLIHKPNVSPENKNSMLILLQSEPQVYESPPRNGSPTSKLHKLTISEGVSNTPKIKEIGFNKIYLMRPVGYHLAREIRDQDRLRSPIWNQMV